MGIKETLLSFMREEAYRPMDIQELVAVFDISQNEYTDFKWTLKIMEKELKILQKKKVNGTADYIVPMRLFSYYREDLV